RHNRPGIGVARSDFLIMGRIRTRCAADASPYAKISTPSSANAEKSGDERDRIDVPAVIGLTMVSGAAVAEEANGISIGAVAEMLEPANARALQTQRYIVGKIEQGVPRA